MSSPAIVLMTDPARCNLGDVHHLVQALLEIQQMGEHATPRAFCDHPEAARDFLDAYAHAYPQLVLEDREIPTPDHLHSLINTGQIGGLGWPAELAPRDSQPPAEPNGVNGFPIVVLTLGSFQPLLDALQQAPTIRESIRLIDVGQERVDVPSVVVASRGLDDELWQHERSRSERPELDDVAGRSKADFMTLALQDDPMGLDVVDIPSGGRWLAQEGEQEVVPVHAFVAAAKPASVAGDERAGSTAPEDGRSGATATEPASPTVPSRSSDSEPVASVETEARVRDEGGDRGDRGDWDHWGEGRWSSDRGTDREACDQASVEEPVTESEKEVGSAVGRESGKGAGKQGGHKADKEAGKHVDKEVDKDVDAAGKAGKGAPEQDDDVYYPPVGSLIAAADVLYPALDQDGAHALCELASVLLDDGIFDPDLASGLVEAQRGEGLSAPARQEAVGAVRSADKTVTFEDAYGASDQGCEDQLADSNVARPLHDSDL